MDLTRDPEFEIFYHKYLDWFNQNCHFDLYWLGRPIRKNPFDAWVYQEIISSTKPTLIIEIGNKFGGSTLFLANILDSLNCGRIIGVDITHDGVKDLQHPRIQWITGDATSQEVLEKITKEISNDDRIMIIEDASHEYLATLKILELYSPLITPGLYFIIEDGICKEDYINGPKPGPIEAIHQFLKTNSDFTIDKKMEKFIFTYNPDGFLKKLQ